MLKRLQKAFRPYHPRNLRRTLLTRKEKESVHSHVFSSKPAVVYLARERFSGVIHQEMPDNRLILLYLFFRTVSPESVLVISPRVREDLKRHPKHRAVMLCNEPATVDLFREQGVEAIFCNHNCCVNENCFAIDEAAEKKYDAIYNAAMAPYKRHLLAAKTSSLALITYRYGGTHESDYEKEVRIALAHGTWLVDAQKDDEKASAAQVAAYYNQARVGLCLSEAEGAMFASIEYLLCGLPVVTTRNTGGRDVFFDPEYVEVVDDTPEAVSQGVSDLIARAPSASTIRAKTLQKMEEHRQRLRELLQDEVPQLEIPWPPGTHGPLTFRNLRTLGRTLREAAGQS
jgi:glycosyltransferase involved in cell wall biosynthesis